MDINFLMEHLTLDLVKVFHPDSVRAMRLDDYVAIQDKVVNVDVSKDDDFQKQFSSFYGIYRIKDLRQWNFVFYDLFEKQKNEEKLSFKKTILWMYENTNAHRIEKSFCSKMLATIDPNLPIIDSHILSMLECKGVQGSVYERIEGWSEIYECIKSFYDKFLSSNKGKEMLSAFDLRLPEYRNISSAKKIDFMFWANVSNVS